MPSMRTRTSESGTGRAGHGPRGATRMAVRAKADQAASQACRVCGGEVNPRGDCVVCGTKQSDPAPAVDAGLSSWLKGDAGDRGLNEWLGAPASAGAPGAAAEAVPKRLSRGEGAVPEGVTA